MGQITWIDIWWNPEPEIWTIQAKDKDGNQIGDAGFDGIKASAILSAKSWKNRLNDSTVEIWLEQKTNFKYVLISGK